MSKLEELIKEYCPGGVEYKALSEVCLFRRGTSLTSKDAKPGNIPAVSGGQKPAFYHNEYNRTGTTITVAGSGAYAGFVNIWYEPIFCCDAFTIEPADEKILDIKYLYHFLLNNQEKIYAKKTGAGIPHVHGKDLYKFQIPLPPLPVQQEIVRILDNFTELNTQLTAELAARKKQYSFYRDQLLTFAADPAKGNDAHMSRIGKMVHELCPDGVEYKALSESVKIMRGRRVVRRQLLDEGAYPVFQNSLTPLGYYDEYNCSADTAYIIVAGAAGEIGYSYVDFWAADDCFYFDGGSDVQNRYLYHVLMQKQSILQSKVRKASIPRLSRTAIEKLTIPLPPLEIQREIVSVLDRFDALCNDLTSGLPAEIEARQKQYEYYRDKLLSFEIKN